MSDSKDYISGKLDVSAEHELWITEQINNAHKKNNSGEMVFHSKSEAELIMKERKERIKSNG
ncbi:hypothetical protein [Vibrio cholerae]|uniref:hypothetical protein n=1 Tax=Vibrio cholerae TaxID=666 RepID=UPI000E678138|nr:hypothetical protein [Vibrio cholerae]MDX5050015.1 hypothetical protein [Vibrio cholerae]